MCICTSLMLLSGVVTGICGGKCVGMPSEVGYEGPSWWYIGGGAAALEYPPSRTNLDAADVEEWLPGKGTWSG